MDLTQAYCLYHVKKWVKRAYGVRKYIEDMIKFGEEEDAEYLKVKRRFNA